MTSIFVKHFLYITNMCLVSGRLFNAAIYKPALMSCVWWGARWTADLANDGNDDTNVVNGHCIATEYDNPGWWMVDLGDLYSVEQIVLVNRGDDYAFSLRTQNFIIDVFEADPRLSPDFPMQLGQECFNRIESVGQVATFTQNCTAPIRGRFVRFISFTLDNVNFCEIKVMVDYVIPTQSTYDATPNAVLQAVPILTTYTDSPSVCTLLCLQHRHSDTCTAFNWVRTTKQCQMLNVDPRKPPLLTPNTNTVFYIEA